VTSPEGKFQITERGGKERSNGKHILKVMNTFSAALIVALLVLLVAVFFIIVIFNVAVVVVFVVC